MEHAFTCVELSDEQLDLVVGGGGGISIKQLAAAMNFSGSNGVNQQNANATNQVGFININLTVQNNILIII